VAKFTATEWICVIGLVLLVVWVTAVYGRQPQVVDLQVQTYTAHTQRAERVSAIIASYYEITPTRPEDGGREGDTDENKVCRIELRNEHGGTLTFDCQDVTAYIEVLSNASTAECFW